MTIQNQAAVVLDVFLCQKITLKAWFKTTKFTLKSNFLEEPVTVVLIKQTGGHSD